MTSINNSDRLSQRSYLASTNAYQLFGVDFGELEMCNLIGSFRIIEIKGIIFELINAFLVDTIGFYFSILYAWK